MRAATRVEVGLDSTGATVVRRMRCEAPLLVRVDGVTTDGWLGLLLVNGAAGPLGGDELEFVLVVGNGARVRVRSVAASLVQPDPLATPSTSRTRLEVGEGATLDWELEPTVSVIGSRHSIVTHLEAAESATVTLADSVQLGRYQERSGELALRQRVSVGGRHMLDHETRFGPGAQSGPGGHGPFRWVQSRVTIADDAATSPAADVDGDTIRGVFPLGRRCALETFAAHSVRRRPE